MYKPLIGVTSNVLNISLNFSSSQEVTLINNSYLKLIYDYGGIPLILNHKMMKGSENYISDICSALLIIGGADISPEVYGEEQLVSYTANGIGEKYRRGKNQAPDLLKDRFEVSLYESFKNKNKPILGICRGMQIINVAEGGSLHQELDNDIVDHYLQSDGWINYHEIGLLKDTKTYDILGEESYFSSSLHHQGIKSLGENLIVSAKSDDGLPEIIEGNGRNFVLGLQGHPEKTRQNLKLYEKIFKNFLEQVK